MFYLNNGTGKDWTGHSNVRLFFAWILTIRVSSPDVNLGATLLTGSE